jgi:hypothetical protein
MTHGNDGLTFPEPMMFCPGRKTELVEGLSRTAAYFEDLFSDGTVRPSIARDQSANA